ncbi:hypothetical protein PSTT_02904 [Puccinia striiformis]|uniref:Secreted protein n=2 Tax=Puccinia striiformis TaxID=27350 RepID=A0A0L0VWV5_9BASI|nr:hypothetical protein PSTG_03202 [Puccinia striiformis f. sp. tritici PST-78]POW14516.1 hypothetical protein PSTT_02904 [Puccinia striiformis]
MPRFLMGVLVCSTLSFILTAPMDLAPHPCLSPDVPFTCPHVEYPAEQAVQSGMRQELVGQESSDGMYPSDPQITMKPPEYLPMEARSPPTEEQKKKIDDILKNYPVGQAYQIGRSNLYTLVQQPYSSKEYMCGRVKIYDLDDSCGGSWRGCFGRKESANASASEGFPRRPGAM